MPDCRFAKMHGAGNDFLMIDDRAGAYPFSRETIAALCSRRRGIGADGLIFIRPSARAQFSMRYFNSDGGEAAMCGNGARCAAVFAHAEGIAGRTMTFESGAGLVEAEITEGGARIGIGGVSDLRLDLELAASDRPVHFGVCGVPHAVVLDAGLLGASREEFVPFARDVRNDAGLGPAGANVNVVAVIDPHRFSYRTYERGVEDETDACGTGAVVIAAVLAHLGLCEPPMRGETSGGDLLDIDLRKTPGGAERCRLTGPVVLAFRGTFRVEDYERL